MDNDKLNPPYSSTGQADKILDIFRRISPKKIDSKFIFENKIATASNASSVVNLVKWLGIIDSNNNVKEEVASKLRLIGEERDKFIAEIIKKSYKEVLEGVSLQQARREDLVNFFINTYGFGIAPAKNASILFLHLCEKYGIPISDELKKKTHTGIPNIKKNEKKTVLPKNKKSQIEDKSKDNPEEKEGIMILSIKGNGIDKKLEARTAKELQELYDNKFKSLVEGAKHFFPEESLQEEPTEED